MTRTNVLTVIMNFIVGWFLAGVLLGSTLALNGLLIVLVLVVALWILRVGGRDDIAYAALGVALAVILSLLLPQFNVDTVGADSLLQSVAALLFVLQA